MNRHNFFLLFSGYCSFVFVICLVALAKTQQNIQKWRKWGTYHFLCLGFRECVFNEITIGGIYCPLLQFTTISKIVKVKLTLKYLEFKSTLCLLKYQIIIDYSTLHIGSTHSSQQHMESFPIFITPQATEQALTNTRKEIIFYPIRLHQNKHRNQ